MPEILLRFDTEDFVTPESDEALSAVLAALSEVEARATFPLVAAKLRVLRERGRSDLISRLAQHSVGYHSATHSVHPTIAEALADLGWEEGVARFLEREGPGAAEVGDQFGRLDCYTQPGGNWVPHAGPALRRWGCPFHYSEEWNAYVDLDGRPFRYGGVLHWSSPVAAPKPFLSRLPAVLDEALAAAAALDARTPANVVTHPTELVTTEFWDAVNWGRGATPTPERWQAAPLRPRAEVIAAASALRNYLAGLRSMGFTFVGADDLVRRYPDRAQGLRVPAEVIRAWPAGDWLIAPGIAVSPAEVFGAAVTVFAQGAPAANLAHLDGPACASPSTPARGPVPHEALQQAARWTLRFLRTKGRIPDAIPLRGGVADPLEFHASLATGVLRPIELRPARRVRPAELLHWDWPIFTPGFTAPNLRAAALRQAWTLKPAVAPEPFDLRGPWRTGATAIS